MQQADVNLLGEPLLDPAQSQWFTPMWLARKLASWVQPNQLVLEPSCGTGNLIAALLEQGHPPNRICGVERDQRMAEFARARFDDKVRITWCDFFTPGHHRMPGWDVVLGNFPFEDNEHLYFTRDALLIAPAVIAIYPSSFEFSQERDAQLWATKGVVRRRARMPERVRYEGGATSTAGSGSFDSVALKIARRHGPRRTGEVLDVREECWRPGDVGTVHG